MEDPTPYRVDGEVGRFTFSCHQVLRQDTVALDTSRQVFPPLTGKQWYRTTGFRELSIVHGAIGMSYRQTRQMLNRIRHQPDATPLRSLQDGVEAEGLAAARALDNEARRVLQEADLDVETLQPAQQLDTCLQRRLPAAVVDAALHEISQDPQTIEAMRANPVPYEDPQVSINVSIDDVLAKKQKEHRDSKAQRTTSEGSGSSGSKAKVAEDQRKCVHTTVAHVQTTAGERIFATAGVVSSCRFVMAFIAANGLLQTNWMFFVDGQRTLQDALLRLFAWQGTIQLILDWHHVDKKCQEKLSAALNNRHFRNKVLPELLALLWDGMVDGAIAHLRQIDPQYVKSTQAVEELVGYFERNRRWIPCYSVRKKLGLRNSSNRGEKANDVVVSVRQKHKGMSWSQAGSSALATLRTLVCNDNHGRWFTTGVVDFRQVA